MNLRIRKRHKKAKPTCEVKTKKILTYFLRKNQHTNIKTGQYNGYVILPNDHPYYGEHYDDIDVCVHGGLTYSDTETIDGVKYFVVGFDTCHLGDSSELWDEAAVEAETIRLKEQLEEAWN